MDLGERLAELRDNILRDRSDQIEGPSDQLWSDDTLLRYIRDGEHRFARQTLCIRDSTTTEYTTLTLRAGVITYPLNKLVLSVLSSSFDTDTFDIQRSGHSLVAQFTPAEFLSYDPSTGYRTQPGRPIAYFTDETLVYARSAQVTYSVYPAPSTVEDKKQMHMRVIRLPMGAYSLSNLDEVSEIPEDYQLDCLEWAAYRAQRHFDADAGAVVPSDKHKAAFDEAVLNAKREIKRSMFANTTLQYGTLGQNYVR